MTVDAPELLKRVREDAVDAVLLVPIARSATRPAAWSPATWKRTASRPW
ncbi:hypothetical protein ACFQU2_09090 [Siccirubricoccus deserti]